MVLDCVLTRVVLGSVSGWFGVCVFEMFKFNWCGWIGCYVVVVVVYAFAVWVARFALYCLGFLLGCLLFIAVGDGLVVCDSCLAMFEFGGLVG